MIPDIESIVDGLIDGTITKEEAIRWIQIHLNAADATGRLDMLNS